MKAIAVLLQIFFFIFLLAQAGCEEPPADDSMRTEPLPKADSGFDSSVFTSYAPVRIDILPLTEFAAGSQINVYVSLLDLFDSQKKSPGAFRFELYEYVQLSAEPRGGRIAIWPDIDLTNIAENHKYWRDFLRAYKFSLPFEPASNKSYILQVTFLCPTGKRLSDNFVFTNPK